MIDLLSRPVRALSKAPVGSRPENGRKPAGSRASLWQVLLLLAVIGLVVLTVAYAVTELGTMQLLLVTGGTVGLALLVLHPTAALLVAVLLLLTNLPVVAAQQGLIPRAAAGLTGLLFVPALAHHLIVRRRRIRVDGAFGLMTVYLGAMLISSFVAVDPGLALTRVGVFAAEGLVLYLLVLNTIRDVPTLRRVLGVLVMAGSLLASMAVYQAASGDYQQDFGGLAQVHSEVEVGAVNPAERENPGTAGRARGPVDDPNRFAQLLLLVLPFAALGWLRGRSRQTRVVAAGATLLLLGGVLLTYSRGAFLTLTVLVALLGVLRYVRPLRIAAAGLVGMLLISQFVPGYVERVQSIAGAVGLFTDDSAVEPDAVTRGRTTEMLAALLTFREHPVVGVGPGQYMPHYSVQYQLRPEISFREIPVPRRAHDLYAELAAETGMVGLLAFLAIPAFLLVQLWKLRESLHRRRPDLEWIVGAFILSILGYLGSGVFLHLAFERYYWFFLALAGTAVGLLREVQEEEGSTGPDGVAENLIRRRRRARSGGHPTDGRRSFP